MAKSGMILNGRELLEQEVEALEPGQLALALTETFLYIQRETFKQAAASGKRNSSITPAAAVTAPEPPAILEKKLPLCTPALG